MGRTIASHRSLFHWISFALLLAGCAGTPGIRDDQGRPLPESIASFEAIEINGIRQQLLIRGERRDLPVLLFVHGGLGTPYAPLAHAFQREWERSFVVVHWEQRGSGKLYREADSRTITTAQLLEDTRAVAAHLRERFGKPIYLMGHSWGSYLAYRTAAAHPDLFQAYIGVGQTVGILEEDRHSHAWVLEEARRRQDRRALRGMERIGPPPYGDVRRAYALKYGLVAEYGGFMHGRKGMGFMFQALLSSPEYSAADVFRFLRGKGKYEASLLENAREEIWGLTIRDIRRMDVPVYFICGEEDQATPCAVLQDYAATLTAPRKSILSIGKAAHFSFIDRREEFTRMLSAIRDSTEAQVGSRREAGAQGRFTDPPARVTTSRGSSGYASRWSRWRS